MKHVTLLSTPEQRNSSPRMVAPVGGLTVRTNLRAGSALDDLGAKAQELWNSLTSALSSLTSDATTTTTTTPQS
ncbi:MAG: hypothetical protein KF832_23260 [Caldilineaceae bacterium]|nr:hypothetical protein [Caldilineaceae bacterium]